MGVQGQKPMCKDGKPIKQCDMNAVPNFSPHAEWVCPAGAANCNEIMLNDLDANDAKMCAGRLICDTKTGQWKAVRGQKPGCKDVKPIKQCDMNAVPNFSPHAEWVCPAGAATCLEIMLVDLDSNDVQTFLPYAEWVCPAGAAPCNEIMLVDLDSNDERMCSGRLWCDERTGEWKPVKGSRPGCKEFEPIVPCDVSDYGFEVENGHWRCSEGGKQMCTLVCENGTSAAGGYKKDKCHEGEWLNLVDADAIQAVCRPPKDVTVKPSL